ncbi:hypothetical protein ABVK25_002084 [Lepraria finkii]|uniref:Uncharacterized protein n=1 Tax=Lepraria finkii TaxID=1340010 RepID=A0ABR4BIZ5_9LECA
MLTVTTSTVLATPLHPHFNISQLTTLLHLPANFSYPALSNAHPICIEDLAWSAGVIGKVSAAGYEGTCRGTLNLLNYIEPIDSTERKFLVSTYRVMPILVWKHRGDMSIAVSSEILLLHVWL